MRPVVTVFLILTMTIATLSCHKETEEDRVKKVITTIQKAAEEKDIKNIISNLSKTYNDPQGYNYNTIKGLVLGYFFRHQSISAYINNLEISVHATIAKATFQAVLTGRGPEQSAVNPIPESLGVYVFVVSLIKESDGWKVTSATWERVGEGQQQ